MRQLSDVARDASSLIHVYGRETRADADIAKVNPNKHRNRKGFLGLRLRSRAFFLFVSSWNPNTNSEPEDPELAQTDSFA
jgi:hypothetical protein